MSYCLPVLQSCRFSKWRSGKSDRLDPPRFSRQQEVGFGCSLSSFPLLEGHDRPFQWIWTLTSRKKTLFSFLPPTPHNKKRPGNDGACKPAETAVSCLRAHLFCLFFTKYSGLFLIIVVLASAVVVSPFLAPNLASVVPPHRNCVETSNPLVSSRLCPDLSSVFVGHLGTSLFVSIIVCSPPAKPFQELFVQ